MFTVKFTVRKNSVYGEILNVYGRHLYLFTVKGLYDTKRLPEGIHENLPIKES